MISEQKEQDMNVRIATQNPAATLREAADRLWKHGESEGGTIIPSDLCFALASQFDCVVDEWTYNQDEDHKQEMFRHLRTADSALQSLKKE